MTDASIPLESGTRILDRFDEIKADDNRYVQEALAKHKHQGLVLAVRARWAALVVIAVMLPF